MHDCFQIYGLTCGHVTDPLAIEQKSVSFGWKVRHPISGRLQKSYRIQVFRKDKNEVPVWDSGVVLSRACYGILYQGPDLLEGEDYQWIVIVEDDQGAIAQSQPAFFGIGITHWKGCWLSGANYMAGDTAPLFRKGFSVPADLVSAKLYLAAVGYAEVTLNGQKISDRVLEPGWTDFRKTVLYSAYDVSKLLRTGENAVGIMMGSGWYSNGNLCYDTASMGGQFLMQLVMIRKNGEKLVVSSDLHQGWLTTSKGPIRRESIYHGETYDARMEKVGWDQPGYLPAAKDGWEEPLWVEPPEGQLRPQVMEPIRVRKCLEPVEIRKTGPDEYVFDFGQNLAGWAELKVQGPRGQKVELKFAENIYPDGSIDVTTTRNAQAQDEYILKGQGEERYEPHFTYHGFRYVRMRGYPGVPGSDALKACLVCSDVTSRGQFSCGNEILNRIHQAVLWTELSNLHSIPTDCPQRDERLGWLNDMTVRAEEAVYNFDMSAFYEKWTDDILEGQGPVTGALPDVAPFFRLGRRPADPVSSSLLVVPWLVYLHTGDKGILEKCYDGMKRWEAYLEKVSDQDIVKFSYFGDWAGPVTVSDPESGASGSYSAVTPPDFISTWAYYLNCVLLKNIARILGREKDFVTYLEMSRRILERFNKRFFREKENQYATGSQAANVCGLLLNMTPQDKSDEVLANLVSNIKEEYNTHLTTGNQCTKYVMDVLTLHDQVDLAFELASQTSYPSWGYMLEHGGTTIWERWEMASTGLVTQCCSQSHPMNASIDAWFYKYLAGIQPDPSAPGFENVLIRPNVPKNLTSAFGALETVRGLVSSEWSQNSSQFAMNVEIPFNATGDVTLQTSGFCSITCDDTVLWQKNDSMSTFQKSITLRIFPGKHSFICRKDN